MAITNIKDVLNALRTIIEEDDRLASYNNVVLIQQVADNESPISGKFSSHCITLWPLSEPEEEERFYKWSDLRFSIEITACVKGGLDQEELMQGNSNKNFIGLGEFIADLKKLLRFNTLDNALDKAPKDAIGEVTYIRVPETNLVKGKFTFTGYKRQDLTA